MNYAEAIAKIKTLEGGAEIATAVEAETTDLKAQKSTAIGEKRKLIQSYADLTGRFKEVTDALGLEVESDDAAKQLAALHEKIKSLQAELTSEQEKSTTSEGLLGDLQTKLDELQTQYDEADGKVTTMERNQKARSMAAKAGAVPDVLVDLLGDRLDELKVVVTDDAEVVMLGDKPLKDAIAADAKLSLYSSALFLTPKDEGEGDDKDLLPGGSGDSDDGKSPVASYLRSRYALPVK